VPTALRPCEGKTWARRKGAFVLLRHKDFGRYLWAAAQQGHLGRVLTRALIRRERIVAIELGT
jgi:hypothetical protein